MLAAQTVGEALVLLRHRAHLTRDELAVAGHVSKGTLSRYERDETARPDPAAIRRLIAILCEALEADLARAWAELGSLLDRDEERSRRILGATARAMRQPGNASDALAGSEGPSRP